MRKFIIVGTIKSVTVYQQYGDFGYREIGPKPTKNYRRNITKNKKKLLKRRQVLIGATALTAATGLLPVVKKMLMEVP